MEPLKLKLVEIMYKFVDFVVHCKAHHLTF